MAQANLVKLWLRLRIFLRKSEAIFSTLDDVRLLRDFPLMKIHLRFKWRRKKKRLPSFRFHYSTARGELFAEVNANEQARSRGSDACPLHLLCKCGVPAYRSRLACRMSFRLRTRQVLAKGSSSILASRRILYLIYTLVCSRKWAKISTLSPILWSRNLKFSSISAAALDWF